MLRRTGFLLNFAWLLDVMIGGEVKRILRLEQKLLLLIGQRGMVQLLLRKTARNGHIRIKCGAHPQLFGSTRDSTTWLRLRWSGIDQSLSWLQDVEYVGLGVFGDIKVVRVDGGGETTLRKSCCLL